MTHVTVTLPNDLAQRAQDAGLLGSASLQELLRKALQQQSAAAAMGRERQLVMGENGYLVAETLPGERPITTEEINSLLDDPEW